MVKLQVYVAEDCWTCEETRRIVADVVSELPDVVVELLDLNNCIRPDNVFAVPTYVLNGRVVFLGNPTRQQLWQRLLAAQQAISA